MSKTMQILCWCFTSAPHVKTLNCQNWKLHKKRQLNPLFCSRIIVPCCCCCWFLFCSNSAICTPLSKHVAEGVTMNTGLSTDVVDHRNGDYTNIKDAENPQLGMFDKPLPCFGCGIGWFSWVFIALLFSISLHLSPIVCLDGCIFSCSLLLGFACPLLWYYATILYFRKYYHKDPRERDGLAANTIAVSATLAV